MIKVKSKLNKLLLTLALTCTLFTTFTMPALASNGDIWKSSTDIGNVTQLILHPSMFLDLLTNMSNYSYEVNGKGYDIAKTNALFIANPTASVVTVQGLIESQLTGIPLVTAKTLSATYSTALGVPYCSVKLPDKTQTVTNLTVDSTKKIEGTDYSVSSGIVNITNVTANNVIIITTSDGNTYTVSQAETINVASVETVSVSTSVGTAPILPATVSATMSDGSVQSVPVKWADVDQSKYVTTGAFTVIGTIDNSTIPALANVTVTTPSLANVSDSEVAYVSVKELSDPKYLGREPGTQGYTKAAQYVANAFQQLGLTPDGDSNTFLQAYQTGLAQFSSEPTLSINGNKLQVMKDFKPHGTSKSGTISGNQLVYVGNGFSSDYSGVDVTGKLVAFTGDMTGTGTPTGVMDRVVYAVNKGAAGALIISGIMYPITSFERPLRYNYSQALADYISPETAQLLGINLSGQTPQIVNAQVQGDISITRTPNQTSYNVLGLIPGQDPTKTVMIEANLDGYGTLPDGTVFPGASADAAGVGDLIGLAYYYHSLKTPPQCNILLAAIGSECYDRSGIQWFLQHQGNVGKIVADVNLYDVGSTEKQKYIAVNAGYSQLDAAARFATKLDSCYSSEVHDSDADTFGSLYNFDNAQMDVTKIPNAFIRMCDSTEDSAADTFETIKQQSLQDSMAIAKQIIFYVSAVNDQPASFNSAAVKQVQVQEVGHTMSEYDTAHFELFWEQPFDQAIPGLVPMLDQVWDEDEWWNYNPVINQKIKLYLVTSSQEGWATAHRTPESTNATSGGIQSPGNYSVSVVMSNGSTDANQIIGCPAHEFNHDAATYNLMKVYHNVTSFANGNIIKQTNCDLDNQECSGHLTPLLFAPNYVGFSGVVQYYSSISDLFQAQNDSNIDWSSYIGDAFQRMTPDQWFPHYDQLGSLYTYIWENYGPDKAREICYAMYADSRNLQSTIQTELNVPFQQVEDDWFTWMKTCNSNSSNTNTNSPLGLHVFNQGFEYIFSQGIRLSGNNVITITDPQGKQISLDSISFSEADSSGLTIRSSSFQKGVVYTVNIQPNAISYVTGDSADPQGMNFTFSVTP
ncbi:Ig-like domain-containing protein [Desulfosporosinus sp. PR]|uniref:Ig-like domain-containing protein n=1 Tax=Candidatus Desulfosporosinus nitrosoreducens TaxID=3401928 RepID=UPI0027E8CE8A|nr:Ig-like domain-containing protein [Desulfosporosinus sp. PR]MDQ7093930.1 Ig-like domain-containing protein [Desulfosporosinus sp. PR]